MALLRFNFNFTAMIFDDPFADGKSQSHAGFFTCGKKGLKNFLQVIAGDAMAGIAHGNYDSYPGNRHRQQAVR